MTSPSLTQISLIAGLLVAAFTISEIQYNKGFKHGETSLNEKYLEMKENYESITKENLKLLDSFSEIKFSSKEIDKKDYTNLVVKNETDNYLFVEYSDIAGMHGGGGSPLAPNFYVKTRIKYKSRYKLTYFAYDNDKKIKGDTLKKSEIRIPVPYPDQYACFCNCDLKKN